MKRVLSVLAAAILVAGCGAQAASNEPNLEERLKAIKAQQQTILTEIEAVQTKQRQLEDKLKDMERKIRNLEADQRSLKMEQENLRSALRSLSLWGSDFDLPDLGGAAPVQAAECEGPLYHSPGEAGAGRGHTHQRGVRGACGPGFGGV